MAKLLWGNVYFNSQFAGVLREESGGRMSFTYDADYLNGGYPSIAYTLPLQKESHLSQLGLHPFFDNLVAEGWLEEAQTRLLGKRVLSRFELLLAFGVDCAGAVSIIDPSPAPLNSAMLDMENDKFRALTNRASLSGVQPKLTLIEKAGKFYPTQMNEISTHIAKFPSAGHNNIIFNELLTMRAFKALLDKDEVADIWIGEIIGFDKPSLIVKRFDRYLGARIHFEEFNQLLGKPSIAKYDGAYKDMASFIATHKQCLPAENYRLFTRILAGILLGNTDMHLKNFAMLHTTSGLRLTPTYDQVAALLYKYNTMALAVGGSSNLLITNLKPANIIKLGEEFTLSPEAILMAVEQLEKNIENAKAAIWDEIYSTTTLKKDLVTIMEKRWKATFALIGQTLSKRRSSAANNSD